MTRTRLTGAPGDAGSVTVEFAVAAPILVLLAAAMVAAGRIVLAHGVVTDVAAAASRAASIARSPTEAQQDATATAHRVLAEQDLSCRHTTVSVDTTGFTVPLGTPASVRVEVTCVVSLGDLAIPGIPGTRILRDAAVSPLDPYRPRA